MRAYLLQATLLLFYFAGGKNLHSQDRMFVTLCAKESIPGHAFVALRRDDINKQISVPEGIWGLYPKGRIQGGKSLVLGEVLEEIREDLLTQSDHKVVVEASNTELGQVLSIIEKWKKGTGYELLTKDCITFLPEVANVFKDKIVIPQRTGLDNLPKEFVKKIKLSNPPGTSPASTLQGGLQRSIGSNTLIVTIERYESSDQCTMGRMLVNGKEICNTLELPWLDNKNKVSSIPLGTYKGRVRTDGGSSGKKSWRIQLDDVPGRSHIQIHLGTRPSQIEGCILVGTMANILECNLGDSESTKAAMEKIKIAFYSDEELLISNPDIDKPIVLTIKSIKAERESGLSKPSGRTIGDNTSFQVKYSVQLVPQLTEVSCWAAAAAMLAGWRDEVSINPAEIAGRIGYWSQYHENGYSINDEKVFRYWGLTYYRMIPEIKNLIELIAENGPLFIVTSEDPNQPNMVHARVVSQISGDGTPSGTILTIYDPWPVSKGSVYEETFEQFIAKYNTVSSRSTGILIAHN
jgi:hypothetical protein